MKRVFPILYTLSFLYACNPGPKNLDGFMVNVSEFRIDNKILKDGDYVEVIGSSGNLTKEHEIDFYNLVVVRSVETGDTINVLVTNFYQSDLNDPKTRFISNTSLIGKVVERGSEAESLKDRNINELKSKSYRKVFYDSEYIRADVRKYPAITGNLGDYTIEGDLENFLN